MGFWKKVLGDGSFEGTNRLFDTTQQSAAVEYEPQTIQNYQSDPQRRERRDLDSMDSIAVETKGVINGPGRIWGPRHVKNDERTGPEAGTYKLATGERVGLGGKMVDGSLGVVEFTDCKRDTGRHVWSSFRPGDEVPALIVEREIKKDVDQYKRRGLKYPFTPDAELAPFFDQDGNFIGRDKNMTFKIRGYADQITGWQEKEMEDWR